ncbi:MAG TPA: hypothetical protein VGI80_07140, partial [Pyrinomonadaceae bacterium]
MSSKTRSIIVKCAALLISFAIGLGIAEGGLRLLEKYQNADRSVAPTVDDPELGFRMTPGSPGHDANGFRNDTVPERVDVVAIGDSQTWGVNVNKP